MRMRALRLSPKTARVQIAESAGVLCLLIGAATLAWRGSPVGVIYCGVAAALTATMPLWAAYLPHTVAPEHPVVRAVAAVAGVLTPVLCAFAFHDLHHRFPKVRTSGLPALAKRKLTSPACGRFPDRSPSPRSTPGTASRAAA
jgi:hypothetical protein